MEENNESPRPFLSFSAGMRALLVIALSFAFILILGKFAQASAFDWLTPSEEKGYLPKDLWLVNILTSVLVFAIPAVVYANVFPMERFGYFRLNKPVPWLSVVLGSLVMILVFPVYNEIISAIHNSVTNPELADYMEETNKLDTWAYQLPNVGSLLFCLFANALIPAICEELFFRASIQQLLMERTRTFLFWTPFDSPASIRHRSIISTALIFTFFHQDIFNAPVIFISGLMLGYVFYWTGSLRITIAMHFIFNATSIFIEYLGQHSAAVRAWEPGIETSIPCTIMAAGLFFLVWRRSNSWKV